MKTILVVGLGTIGTLYGWALSEAGVDVTHLVRKGRKQNYTNGIPLDVYDLRANHLEEQKTIYFPKCLEEEEIGDRFDLVMIPTKSTQLIPAIKQVKAKVQKAPFLLFCAYWGERESLDNILDREKYLFGYAGSTAGYMGDTTMLNVKPSYRIESHPLSEQVIDLFNRADFIPEIKPDMLNWLWAHHAIVAGLMGTFLFVDMNNVMESSVVKKNLIPAIKEALEVAKMRGVDLDEDKEAQLFLLKDENAAFDKFKKGFLSGKAGERVLTSGHQVTSQDEMRQFYLDILETGRKLGVSMPTLESYEEKLKGIAKIR